MKPRCQARASRTDEQCKQPAFVDADGDGVLDSCFHEFHQRQIRARTAAPPPAVPPRPPSVDAQSSPPPSSSAIESTPLEDEPIARPPADQVVSGNLDQLEQLASKAFSGGRAIPEDPAAAAELVDQEREPELKVTIVIGPITADDVADWLNDWVNPTLEANGRKPLTKAQLASGGKVYAKVINHLLAKLNVNPDSVYAPAIAWSVLTLGPKFGPLILAKIMGRDDGGDDGRGDVVTEAPKHPNGDGSGLGARRAARLSRTQ